MNTNFSIVPEVMMHHPAMAGKLIKTFTGSKLSTHIDRRFKAGTTSHLNLLTFRITPMCNLRCVMCNQRGTTGVLKGQHAAQEAKNILPLERYKEMVDEVAPRHPIFYVWGGEPFLYPHLMDLAAYTVKKGPVWTVNTNGTFLKKHAERIVADGWHGLFVSLDSFEEVNDTIRGEGSYRKVVEGFDEINRQKEKYNSHLPYLGIVTTVSNLNYAYLDKLVEAVKDYKLSWHIINLGTYTTEKIVEENKQFYREHFDMEPTSWEGFLNGYNQGIDGTLFKDILKRVHAIDTGYPIITVPAINPDRIETYYSDLERPVRDRCAVPWFQANIDYNGDVSFCADYPDYVLGNLKDDSLMNIFNNERAVKFRQELKKTERGLFPGCVRCYQNMLCGRRLPGF